MRPFWMHLIYYISHITVILIKCRAAEKFVASIARLSGSAGEKEIPYKRDVYYDSNYNIYKYATEADEEAVKRTSKAKMPEGYHYPYRPKFPAHPYFGMCRIEDFIFNEEDRVGRGGFGQVFRATHKSGKIVAIKVTSRESIKVKPKHVENEETIQKSLVHPNIAQLLCSMNNEKNDVFFVLEYFDGGNLSKQLSTQFPLSRQLMVKYVAQIVKTLRYIHSYCIVYRDLKAENIMINEFDNIKLIDFGLSVYDCENQQFSLAGTLEYVAPEVAGRMKYGRSCDYYSLGILIHLLQTRRLPYRRKKEGKSRFAERISRGELQVPKTGDQEVDELIAILTDHDSKRRWERVYKDFESFKKLGFFKGYDWDDSFELF